MSSRSVAAAILEHADDYRRLLLSRGLDPRIRSDIAGAIETGASTVEELPCVRGEVVLPTDLRSDDVVVVGHPNWLGRFDPKPVHARAVVVTEPRLGAHRSLSPTATVVVGAAGSATAAEEGRRRAGRLAKRLAQLPGVAPAYGTPVSAVFIVVVDVDPEFVARRLPSPAESVSAFYPELPGGVRVDAMEVAETDVAAYAAAMENTIRSARG